MAEQTIEDVASSIRQAAPRQIAQVALVMLAILFVGWLAYSARVALEPFALGLAVAYLIWPVVNRLGKKMPRWLAIVLVYAVAAVLIWLFFLLVIPPFLGQLRRLLENLPKLEDFRRLEHEITIWYEQNVPPNLQAPLNATLSAIFPDFQKNLNDALHSVGTSLVGKISQLFSAITFLFGFLIIPIWVFYLLMDQRRAKNFISRLLHYRMRDDFWNAWRLTDKSLNAYIRSQLTLSALIGLAAGVGMTILNALPNIQIDYIVVLAIWAGFAKLIPMIGSVLGATPAVIVALIVGGPVSAIAVTLLFVAIDFTENYVLIPRIIGHSVGVHPVILMMSIVAFGHTLGLIGVVLAAPITAILRDLFLYSYRRLGGSSPDEVMKSLHA